MLKYYITLLIFFTLTACSVVHHSNPQASKENVSLGLAYLKAGSTEKAKSKLLLALEQDSKNSFAYSSYGYFLEQSDEAECAEKYYLKAIALANNYDKGASYNNYGTYLYRQKRYREAIKYFLKAIREKSYLHDAAAYENAGLAALESNDKKFAKIYFQKALANDPQRVYSKELLKTIN